MPNGTGRRAGKASTTTPASRHSRISYSCADMCGLRRNTEQTVSFLFCPPLLSPFSIRIAGLGLRSSTPFSRDVLLSLGYPVHDQCSGMRLEPGRTARASGQ